MLLPQGSCPLRGPSSSPSSCLSFQRDPKMLLTELKATAFRTFSVGEAYSTCFRKPLLSECSVVNSNPYILDSEPWWDWFNLTGKGVTWCRTDITGIGSWIIRLIVMLYRQIVSVVALIVYKIGASATFIKRNNFNTCWKSWYSFIFYFENMQYWIVLVGIVMWYCESGRCNSVTYVKQCTAGERSHTENRWSSTILIKY